LLLAAILLAYLVIGTLYAVCTPAWQVPDEPAHYNYVRYLADTGRFPVLQMGDYPHDYLEELKARRFPADLSIDPMRYESHQPPLYYLLAVPVYWLAGGQLLALRLLSVVLGAILLLAAYRLVRAIFPDQAALALGTAAFVAFVPMHVAMMAGVDNDSLAELLLAVVALLAVRYVATGREGQPVAWRQLLSMGIVLGLVLVTKTTAYAAAPVVLAAVVYRWHSTRQGATKPYRSLGLQSLVSLGPAFLIALPWYVRNGVTYGWLDITGLRWHDAVVLGQPRTGEWIARTGWADFLRRFAEFSFKSFWGVFGWMGVFVDNRIYQALGLLCGVVAAGLVALLVRRRILPSMPVPRRQQLGLLGLWIGWTALQYLGYNLAFVQHQGRYLFPALIPIGLAFGLGWREVLRPGVSRWVAALLVLGALSLALLGLVSGNWPTWPLLLTAAGAAGLFVRRWLPRRLDGLLFALPFIGLAVLDLVSLFVFIVPALS